MSIDEMIVVLQAAKDGKMIQGRHKEDMTKEWRGYEYEAECGPTWNFFSYDYRVAPEPREFWVNEFDSGELESLTQYLGNPDHVEVRRRVRFVEDIAGQ